jgi:UDP-N-acetylmuramoyl-tripeptide--D-alanyl-D-alanine ligase
VKDWSAERVAAAAGARLLGGRPDGPVGFVIDSREVQPGDLFIGLAGAHDDGGRFAQQALEAGAWGALVRPRYAHGLSGTILEHDEPLIALQSLARAWRQALGATVIAITGSTGKTSTKDILAALLVEHRATVASRGNLNTEIGLPLAILSAPAGTEVLVLELAMRAKGEIAELAAIAQPDVGLIVNIGPAHLEQLRSLEAIAAAKAELLAALPPAGTAIIPADEPLLDAHLPRGPRVVRFGPGGDVSLSSVTDEGVELAAFGELRRLDPPFRSAHLLSDLCAAVATAESIGVHTGGRFEVELTPLRGERVELAGGVTLINDGSNANPVSMRAALAELADERSAVRRIAVLGDMLELGREGPGFHVVLGEQATDARVLILVTVGALAELAGETFVGGEHFHAADADEAAAILAPLLQRGDLVLVKASRAVGLERVARRLALMRAGS